jgi:putative SOS response-associated peptidase YedK
MCGRYSITTPAEAMRRLFRLRGATPNIRARYNVAPRQDAPVVRVEDGERRLVQLRWGLVPYWAKDALIGDKLINARADTLAERPSFRAAFRARRCLVPADGFYEWRREGKRNQPYRVELLDRAPFAFAGLWESWRGTDGEKLETFAIVTTEAAPAIAAIHHRMPVILPEDAHEAWLSAASSLATLAALLKPLDGPIHAYAVGDRVNAARNDDEGLLDPAPPATLEAEPKAQGRLL